MAKLGGYKLPIYILAQEPLSVSVDSDVSSVCHTVLNTYQYNYLLQFIICRMKFPIMKRFLLCQNQFGVSYKFYRMHN